MPHFCLCDSGYEEVGGLQLSTGILLSTCMYPYYLDSCSLPLLVMFLGVGWLGFMSILYLIVPICYNDKLHILL